ncbi:MAG: dipicolinate synthase subunit DpsA [Clostridia bacterium]|nr:dipicolinate synthase subunit DpsA [Clostridia bacterium]
MGKKIAVVGGDLRMIYLSKMLSKHNTVLTFGQEMAEIKTDAMKIDDLKSAIELSDIIIGPIPFTKDGENINTSYSKEKILIKDFIRHSSGKTVITGAVKEDVLDLSEKKDVHIIDLMKEESLTVLNTIATAEGTIELAMQRTKRTIHGSKVLILGYGRVAKVVAQKFNAINALVTCAARKEEAFAWMEVEGYKSININKLGSNLGEYDIIINTPPTIILTKERLQKLKRDCLVIDLASRPGGVDQDAINKLNINYEWALGLPGKVAPITAAEHISQTLERILMEVEI